MEPYRHIQFGRLIVISFAAVFFFVMGGFLFSQELPFELFVWMLGSLGTLFFVLGLLFSHLTVEVDANEIRLWFGIGLVRKQWPLSDIETVEITKTRIWEGWGIHRTFRGRLYNVDGFDAVKIQLKNGANILIGTDEPEVLMQEIQQRMR